MITDDEATDYALQRRRLRDAEERVTEAHALIRDMLPQLRAPGWDCPGHVRAQAAIKGIRKRAAALGVVG